MGLEDLDLYVRRLDAPPANYGALQNQGILPEWSGPGYLYKYAVPPTNRSSIDKSNWKTACIFILDSPNPNPLNCSNTFRRIGE